MHETLSLHCSKGVSSSFAWYDKRVDMNCLLIKGKSLEKIDNQLFDRQRPPVYLAPQPSPDKVVSELSFGIWPDVLNQLNKPQASAVLPKVFAHHPDSSKKFWNSPAEQQKIIETIKRVQKYRNRICHNEPLWKGHFLSLAAKSNWSHSVQAIQKEHGEFVQLLGWVSPEVVQFYKAGFAYNWFNKLCTTNAVKAFVSNLNETAHLKDIVAPAVQDLGMIVPTNTPSSVLAGVLLQAQEEARTD